MSIVNYSLPFAAAPATPFLSGLPGYNTAPAVNSLFYERSAPSLSQHLGGRQTYQLAPPPAAPSRKTATTPRRQVNNDPYRNQQPQQPPPDRQQNYYNDNDNYRSNIAPQRKQEQYPSIPAQGYPPQKKQDAYPSNPQGYPPQKSQDAYPSNSQGYPPSKKQTQDNYPPSPTTFSSPPKKPEQYPSNPPGYTRISDTPSQSAKTTLHAVLDYDDDFDDYSYEDEDVAELPPEYRHVPLPAVTPIQGPIFIKNNSVPVVPLFSHPVLNNGSFVQIPILWTALSVALGLEIRGEVIRGVPCIKRFHQLFCPTAGNSYPTDRIDRFIDDNKALMKRMYGEFQMSTEYGPPSRETYGDQGKRNVKREAPEEGGGKRNPRKTPPGRPGAYQPPPPDLPSPGAEAPNAGQESYFSKLRETRQSFRNNQSSESGRVDACESKIEITTPYWASNSAGKIRAIVNTQHFEQAIHQEVCSSKMQTKRCSGDCGCEQKYKWHRLLAYDPDNDCKGIFMDWFLFPSCCVCRCAPIFGDQ